MAGKAIARDFQRHADRNATAGQAQAMAGQTAEPALTFVATRD